MFIEILAFVVSPLMFLLANVVYILVRGYNKKNGCPVAHWDYGVKFFDHFDEFKRLHQENGTIWIYYLCCSIQILTIGVMFLPVILAFIL